MDGDVQKEVLKTGENDIPLYQKNTKVGLSLEAESLSADDSAVERVIDDTRTLGTGPFELLVGREFKLHLWEDVVKTMRIGEIVRFKCSYEVFLDYISVSKALRELAKRNAGKEMDNHHHNCGFHHVTGGTGYCDLDEVIKKGSPIAFEFELLNVKQPGEYTQDSWAMTTSEKTDAIATLRTEGNSLYNQGRYEEAAQKYFLALSYLEELSIREKVHSDAWNHIEERKIPLLLNYAQCKLISKDYAEVIRHTTTVLEFDSNNVKALFRRGKAHANRWDMEEAKTDLTLASQLDPSLSKLVEMELEMLAKKVEEKNAIERKLLKGKLFG